MFLGNICSRFLSMVCMVSSWFRLVTKSLIRRMFSLYTCVLCAQHDSWSKQSIVHEQCSLLRLQVSFYCGSWSYCCVRCNDCLSCFWFSSRALCFEAVFLTIKIVGTAYLLWIAFNLWRSGASPVSELENTRNR